MADAHRGSSRQRGVQALVVVLAAALVAVCAWALTGYAQGSDPLAWIDSQPALQTIQEENGSASDGSEAPHDGDAAQTGDGSAGEAQENRGGATSGSSNSGDASNKGSRASANGSASTNGNSSNGNSSNSGSDSKDGNASEGSQNSNAGKSDDAAGTAHSGGDSGGSGHSSSAPGAKDQHQSQRPAQPQTITVSVTIDGTPAGGSRHGGTATLQRGANVYDALVAVDGNINARGSTYGTYVAAIDGLAEKQHGTASGWLYSVNGVRANTACSNYRLSDGDVVTWTYWTGDELPS